MKRLNQTESSIFMILCVLCFKREFFLIFIVVIKDLILFFPVSAKVLQDLKQKTEKKSCDES